MEREWKYKELTRRIIGVAMKAHASLGSGFQELIYQRALAIELKKAGLEFSREFTMKIYYDGLVIGERRVDFLVEDKIMVEIKAVSRLENVHLAQTSNYLQAYNLEIGLLLNFGSTSLEVKRLTNPRCR